MKSPVAILRSICLASRFRTFREGLTPFLQLIAPRYVLLRCTPFSYLGFHPSNNAASSVTIASLSTRTRRRKSAQSTRLRLRVSYASHFIARDRVFPRIYSVTLPSQTCTVQTCTVHLLIFFLCTAAFPAFHSQGPSRLSPHREDDDDDDDDDDEEKGDAQEKSDDENDSRDHHGGNRDTTLDDDDEEGDIPRPDAESRPSSGRQTRSSSLHPDHPQTRSSSQKLRSVQTAPPPSIDAYPRFTAASTLGVNPADDAMLGVLGSSGDPVPDVGTANTRSPGAYTPPESFRCPLLTNFLLLTQATLLRLTTNRPSVR